MRLYHTGQTVIDVPDIHHGRKNADFGQGFYLTPDREFAYKWAMKEAVINKYELDMEGLDVHYFKRDEAWFKYLFDNRNAVDACDADVIIGPIANDTIFNTCGVLTSNLIKPEDAVNILSFGPEYFQVVLKSKKAAEQLRFLGSEVITRDNLDREEARREEEEYLNEIAEYMGKYSDDDVAV